MNITIVESPLRIELYGLSGYVENETYGPTGRQLMERMDEKMKTGDFRPVGPCVWVYDEDNMMFTGFVFGPALPEDSGLEHKVIELDHYALYKHVGPYEVLGQVHDDLDTELRERGITRLYPSLERYGHWDSDPNKLETDVITNFE